MVRPRTSGQDTRRGTQCLQLGVDGAVCVLLALPVDCEDAFSPFAKAPQKGSHLTTGADADALGPAVCLLGSAIRGAHLVRDLFKPCHACLSRLQVLFKMLNRGLFREINGCVSTGKEANVYHATGPEGQGDMAIKVYKTSILVFKDRDRWAGSGLGCEGGGRAGRQ